jgi:hypothetical protein
MVDIVGTIAVDLVAGVAGQFLALRTGVNMKGAIQQMG